MKKLLTLLTLAATLATSPSFAQIVFSNNFGTGYTNGNLVGQNGWTQTSTASNNPLQISNTNTAAIGTTGQDAWNAFGTVITNANHVGGYVLTTIDLTLNTAQAAGDYFFHLSSPTNTTTAFFQRLYARSTNTGFQFGMSVSSTNVGNPLIWGTNELSFSTSYKAVFKWDIISGASNDVISLFIDPTGDITTNITYATATWATNEPTTLAAANFRQGSAANAPALDVRSIQVEVVPEPSTVAMLSLAGLGFAGYLVRRRRRG
jgi:hypothetical protein